MLPKRKSKNLTKNKASQSKMWFFNHELFGGIYAQLTSSKRIPKKKGKKTQSNRLKS